MTRCRASQPRLRLLLTAGLLSLLFTPTSEAARASGDLLAETRAARDAGDYRRAEALARRGLGGSADAVWPLTLALILADQGRSAEAIQLLQAPHEPPLTQIERLRAEGYAHLRAGDDFAAMRAYGEALLLDPGNAEARETLATLLDRQRAPHGAARLAGAPAAREADQAAALTRWGPEVRPPDPERRFEITDRAIAAHDSLLARLAEAPASDPALERRVRLDRIVALRDRVRMAEVVAEAEELQRDAALPPYALQAEADARLHLRQPDRALQLYESLLETEPDDIQAAYGRIFALIETERLAEAIRSADSVAASRPRFIGFAGGPATTPDPEALYAAQLAAEVRLWSNLEAEGHAGLRALAEAAPANPSLRVAMSGAHGARGWPRAAEAEAEIAASLDPDGLSPQIALADTALVRRRYPRAGQRIEALLRLAPENVRVARLAKEHHAATGWQLEADGSLSFGDGGGDNRLGDGHVLMGRLSSPIVAQNLRLFAEAENSRATPVEGTAERTRLAAGLAVEGVDMVARAHVAANLGALDRAGAGLSIDWWADDRWSFALEGELFSRQTPLRALLAGIRADAVTAAARFRRDERFEVAARVGWLGFSDGNDRWWGGVSAAQRLVSAPHFDLSGRADLWFSSNSAPGGPYFAPERDLSATLGLGAQHVAWRRYERAFVHALDVDAGLYQQRGFESDWIATARYEHRWRFDPWREVITGVTVSRRVYDGEPERTLALHAGLRQRF
jgi:biofilm PGA synthesis protein PgaA